MSANPRTPSRWNFSPLYLRYFRLLLVFSLLFSRAWGDDQFLDAPPADRFVRRGYVRGMQSLPTSSHIQEAIEAVLTPPKATALGNYVYIDGGLIAQKVGGQVQPDHYPADPMNSTLSIDISKSWSAETVEFKVTPKTDGPISLRLQAIWNDPNGDAFYIIGGRALYGSRKDELVKDGIWRFSVDGQGGGTWAKEQPSNLDVFQTINLTDGPTFASTYGPSGGIGIAIGGWYDDQTDPNKYNESGWSNTMITYNMNTKIVSTSDMSKVVPPAGYLSLSSAEFVPQLAPTVWSSLWEEHHIQVRRMARTPAG